MFRLQRVSRAPSEGELISPGVLLDLISRCSIVLEPSLSFVLGLPSCSSAPHEHLRRDSLARPRRFDLRAAGLGKYVGKCTGNRLGAMFDL